MKKWGEIAASFEWHIFCINANRMVWGTVSEDWQKSHRVKEAARGPQEAQGTAPGRQQRSEWLIQMLVANPVPSVATGKER